MVDPPIQYARSGDGESLGFVVVGGAGLAAKIVAVLSGYLDSEPATRETLDGER